MKKKIGAIVSVLKPVDDTRMYEKMAQSLARTGKFSVNILGFSSNTHSISADIQFHPLFKFGSKKLARLLANPVIFWKLLSVKPSFIIVCTPELTPAILLFKVLFKEITIVYDIQENYQRNIEHHYDKNSFLLKRLTRIVDFIEKQLARHSELLLVAEKGYYLEKSWLKECKNLTLENKVLRLENPVTRVRETEIKLVYTGTISSIYGIWNALRFAEQLYNPNHTIRLRLVGHVTQNHTYQKLRKWLIGKPWIQSDISLHPIPHHRLLAAMENADFGIVSHNILPSTENCFPTRIWEYMRITLPFFLQNHAPWVNYCSDWQCAILIDFTRKDWPIHKIIAEMNEREFYGNGKPTDIYWENEKFTSAVEELVAT